ncbi:HD domain-containing protein [Legionella septentrionalis]|uniref:HD domain-containing protein n=1 Tax=Legionella septentrionalis TaxID=2498109 RepID=A0A3S0XFY2_9GAMM|nr:HD domain-containing protein [Legionella septentrionalis]RUQ85128.1 HD domain-containing protein [Legionella septentrionalis]
MFRKKISPKCENNKTAPSTCHIITDPIHGAMSFSSEEKILIKYFIDLPIFQRLKRIKQLGCADMIFPGAVHTRFSHSLGACYIAKLICDKLNIPQEDRLIIMIAALLHDIGHGPFSHAFETIYSDFGEAKISHDKQWTPKFIRNISENLGGKNSNLMHLVLQIFSDDNNDYYKPLISSQLDVDRLDYLLRDSHFCGVPYGSVDLQWIISCLELREVNGIKVICITPKGIGAVEHYILSRRLMTKYIYYHGKKNSSEYLIANFLKNLECHLDDSELAKTPLFLFMRKYFEYKNLVLNNKYSETNKNKFIDTSYEYYKEITDDDIWVAMRRLSKEKSIAGILAKKIYYRELPSSYLINPARILDAERIIENYRNSETENEKWQVYFDELKFESYGTKKIPIYVTEDKTITDLYYSSYMLNQISDKPEPTYFLYLDKDYQRKNKLLKELDKHHCLAVPYFE